MLGNTEGIYNIFGMRVYSGVSVTWLLPPPDNAVTPHFFLNGGLHAAISAASESDTARERACVCVCVCLHELGHVFHMPLCVSVCVCVYVITVPQNTLWKVFTPLTRAVKNLELSAALTPLP